MPLTDRDKAMRMGRITASTVSKVVGLHPYAPPTMAWEEITGRSTFAGNDLTEMGDELEAPLLRIAARRLGGIEIVPAPGTVLHPGQEQWSAASADGLIPAWNSGIQIKCHGPGAHDSYLGKPGERGEYSNDLVPLYHNLQCQWEMAVFGASFWYLAVFFNIADFRLYKLRRDDPLLSRMAAKARAWWELHVWEQGPRQTPNDDNWKPELGKAKRPKRKTDADWLNMGATA